VTGYEETLLARAEVLEDTGDLAEAVLGVLAGAQGAGADPAAAASLIAAARALDPGADTGQGWQLLDTRRFAMRTPVFPAQAKIRVPSVRIICGTRALATGQTARCSRGKNPLNAPAQRQASAA
jgi:hypothetical protein